MTKNFLLNPDLFDYNTDFIYLEIKTKKCIVINIDYLNLSKTFKDDF